MFLNSTTPSRSNTPLVLVRFTSLNLVPRTPFFSVEPSQIESDGDDVISTPSLRHLLANAAIRRPRA